MVLPNAVHIIDIGLIVGLLVTVGTAGFGYGRLSQLVAYLAEDAKD